MPVRLDGTTSDFLELTSTGIWSSTSYTVTFWMQVVNANAGANRTFFSISNAGGSEQRVWRPGSNIDGYIQNPGPVLANMDSNEDESSWHMWAITASGTSAGNGNVYRWKAGDPDGTYGTLSFTPNSFTPVEIYVGGTYYSTGRDARFCFIKAWDQALSLAELQAERASGAPVRTANLNRYHRLLDASDTADYSGNGRTIALNGAVTEGSEPVGWPGLQFYQYDWPHQLHARR